jgi:uncharacterized protein YcsI (UPF0317 family)
LIAHVFEAKQLARFAFALVSRQASDRFNFIVGCSPCFERGAVQNACAIFNATLHI